MPLVKISRTYDPLGWRDVQVDGFRVGEARHRVDGDWEFRPAEGSAILWKERFPPRTVSSMPLLRKQLQEDARR